MKVRSLESQHRRLIWLLEQAASFDNSQLELQAHWARYLCVLSAGFLENALTEVYSEYAKACASVNVANFVSARLSRIQNPKAGRFLETAQGFDKSWGHGLDEFLSLGGRREAIDAIMSNRHLIAHGKDSGISLIRVKEYLKKSVEVVEFIEKQCGIAVL